MNDLERIIKEMREDRDIWKSIARQLSLEPKFEVWDADGRIHGDRHHYQRLREPYRWRGLYMAV